MAMDTGTVHTAASYNGAVRPPRARIAPLRFPSLPATLLVQLGGGVSALAGVYVTFGAGVTMIVGGIAATVLGALREAGKV
jgi:hypothetical protein